jgi:hypothetical protein
MRRRASDAGQAGAGDGSEIAPPANATVEGVTTESRIPTASRSGRIGAIDGTSPEVHPDPKPSNVPSDALMEGH